MKFFICFVAFVGMAQCGLLPHLEHHHHENGLSHHDVDVPHFVDADIHHSDGIHLGHHSAAILHDDHHVEHPVYHHDDHHVVDHHHVDVAPAPAKIVHHEPGHHHQVAHLHAAPVVHHHSHSHSALVHHRAAYPAHLDVHSHANLLSFAKHHLHGKYGKVRITETHY
ncbi:histidine-rich glycoprotein [Drosophila tropicalis]|uniref:histidine-rich glycoprotein n=1 Tax=Drosophila tropicalis TaxID=46794 RepID=UPI0035AB9E99